MKDVPALSLARFILFGCILLVLVDFLKLNSQIILKTFRAYAFDITDVPEYINIIPKNNSSHIYIREALTKITIAPNGSVYALANSTGNVIEILNSSVEIHVIDASDPNSPDSPSCIYADSTYIYICNGIYGNIKKYDTNFNFIANIGTSGLTEGKISSATGIQSDSLGNLYVIDRSNNKILKYDSSGVFLLEWAITSPEDFAVSASNQIYVINSTAYISIFDTNGNLIDSWQSLDVNNTHIVDNTGIDVDDDDNVYIVDALNKTIQKYDTEGNLISRVGDGNTGEEDDDIGIPLSVGVDAFGNMYVIEDSDLKIRDSSFNFVRRYSRENFIDGWFKSIYAIGIDSDDNLYIPDRDKGVVQKFDEDGDFILKWSIGSNTGSYSIASDSNNNIYVPMCNSSLLKVYDSNGNYLRQIGSGSGSGDGELSCPYYVVVGTNNKVYVNDYNNTRIQVFDTDGNYLSQWNSYNSINLGYMEGITIDADNNIYVLDSDNSKIIKFDENGSWISDFGVNGYISLDNDGTFAQIYIDKSHDILYVPDSENAVITKYDLNGDLIGSFLEYGHVQGSVVCPNGIVTSSDGVNVYVADCTASNVQIFSYEEDSPTVNTDELIEDDESYDFNIKDIESYLDVENQSGIAPKTNGKPSLIFKAIDQNRYGLDIEKYQLRIFKTDSLGRIRGEDYTWIDNINPTAPGNNNYRTTDGIKIKYSNLNISISPISSKYRLMPGKYFIKIRAYDELGNHTDSKIFGFRVVY